MNGILNVYKKKGKTSHDVVSAVRRITRLKRVGHTGTLDPDAEGVLPICVGKATRAAELLTAAEKAYTAVLRLGVTTDTQDMTGNILTSCVPSCTQEDILSAVSSFIGEQEQIPPMYSAVKVGGKKLYELARQGETVERKPRKITIYDIQVTKIEGGLVTMEVECSKGTYIRTLCEDIGNALGCGGAMESLLRTKSGIFRLEDAHTLEEIGENPTEYLIAVDSLFSELAAITLSEEDTARVKNGASPRYRGEEGEEFRLYDHEGNFLCLSRCEKGLLRMVKGFY